MLDQIPEEHHKGCKDISDKVLKELEDYETELLKCYKSELLDVCPASKEFVRVVIERKGKGAYLQGYGKLFLGFCINPSNGCITAGTAKLISNSENGADYHIGGKKYIQDFFQNVSEPSDVELSEFFAHFGEEYILSEGGLKRIINGFGEDRIEFHTAFPS